MVRGGSRTFAMSMKLKLTGFPVTALIQTEIDCLDAFDSTGVLASHVTFGRAKSNQNWTNTAI
jgi:hypothetical protein